MSGDFERAAESLIGGHLGESGLSRIYNHVMNFDCAIITAFRNDPKDREMCCDPDEFQYSPDERTRDINKLNNRDLKATLLSLGYGVTRADGSFIENYETVHAVEVKEDSLFVVNLDNKEDFFDRIEELGRKYCQDSVLLIPKGGEKAYLLGTNHSEFPGLGNKVLVGRWKGGRTAEFMTRVKGRPFVFETYGSLSRMERMAVKAIAKRVLGE